MHLVTYILLFPGQQQEATIALNQTIDFLSLHFASDLSDYQGNDFQTILEKLRQKYRNNHEGNGERAAVIDVNDSDDTTTTGGGRSIPVSRSFFHSSSPLESDSRRGEESMQNAEDLRRKYKRNAFDFESADRRSSEPRERLRTAHAVSSNRERSEKKTLENFGYSIDEQNNPDSFSIDREIDAKNSISNFKNRFLNSQNSFDIRRLRRRRIRQNSKESDVRVKALRRSVDARKTEEYETAFDDATIPPKSTANPTPDDFSSAKEHLGGNCYSGHVTPVFLSGNKHAVKLLKIAHTLHYASIAILGIFVLQARL